MLWGKPWHAEKENRREEEAHLAGGKAAIAQLT